jgi:hypothetical protein
VPADHTPNGGWLLFEYLRYAEKLARAYEQREREPREHDDDESAQEVEGAESNSIPDQAAGANVDEPAVHVPRVETNPIEPFSRFSLGLAEELAAAHRVGGLVHWGNAGFRIDIVLQPAQPSSSATAGSAVAEGAVKGTGNAPVGVLCDFAQYARAQDPVEWDVFRTAIHESQGWRLHRVWSPQFFRDAQRTIGVIARDLKSAANSRR